VERLTISIGEEQMDALNTISKKTDTPVAELVRQAIRAYLQLIDPKCYR
jgi:metal-responsive CopG/Arc/MetJ family transcriptional regulator